VAETIAGEQPSGTFLPGIKALPEASAVNPKPTAAASPFPPVKFLDASGWGKNIQRTMRLLATSTAEKRNTVRSPVLFRAGECFPSGLWSSRVLIVEHVVVATK